MLRIGESFSYEKQTFMADTDDVCVDLRSSVTPAFAGRQALNERCALIIGVRSAFKFIIVMITRG